MPEKTGWRWAIEDGLPNAGLQVFARERAGWRAAGGLAEKITQMVRIVSRFFTFSALL